jgi:signal transduction histidine kinase
VTHIDPPPSLDELTDLVPASQIRHSAWRTRGESIAASVRDLPPADAATVQALYACLGELLARVGERRDGGAEVLTEVSAYLRACDWTALTPRVSGLGAELDRETAPPHVREAYHDIRGGGLPALVMHLEAVLADEAEDGDVERIFLLCRDQRKIIRNALPDLDPDGYAGDLEPRTHTTELLQKWSTASYRVGDQPAEIDLRCDFDGEISQCCMEFAALDRVIYNLVNNAARFAVDGRVALEVFPIRPDVETDLRIVVTNRVDPGRRERLLQDLGGELGHVFEGGYTTGGTGLGLRICADLVSHGYGLPSLRAALDRGYLGARLVRDHFVAWFHWPARRSAA